jgi:SPX domain protein involved in polyphosphate accumulation
MGDQMVFKRYEIKYMLTKSQYNMLKKEMAAYMIADIHGKSTILSLYMDTPENLLIRRSIEGPFYKEKVRLRSYGVAEKDTEVFLELKKKCNSVVYKRREGMTEQQLEDYLYQNVMPKDTQIMREIDYSIRRYPGLAPKMMLSYEREAYYASNDHEFRITFDENILWRTEDLSLCSKVYGTPLLPPGQVLMEVKAAEAIPLWLVQFMSKNHIYKTSFSKYGTAYKINEQNLQNGGIYRYA